VIYEEYLRELRAARFGPRACARYAAAAARRVRLDVAANSGAARSLLILGFVLFACAFAGCLALAIIADLALARRILVWSGAWIAALIAILIANIDLLRDRDGYRLSAVNLPIALTAARFCVVPGLALALAAGLYRTAFWLYIGVALTDVVDGWLARRTHQVTVMGRLMDPMVDLVFLLGVLIAMHVAGRVGETAFVLGLVRYGGMIAGGCVLRVARGPVRIESTVPGKISGLLIATVIGFLLLLPAYGGGRFWGRLGPLAEDALCVLLAAGIVHGAILAWTNWRHAGEAAAADKVIRDVRFGGMPEGR
jgi:cardiolipin synthase